MTDFQKEAWEAVKAVRVRVDLSSIAKKVGATRVTDLDPENAPNGVRLEGVKLFPKAEK